MNTLGEGTTLENRYKSKKPIVVLMVNDKLHCNMSCEHCYLPYDGVRPPESVLKLIDKLKPHFDIIIAGSETLVDLGYLEAYRQAGQKYLLTNGLLLRQRPEIFDQLKEYGIDELQISYHFGIQKELHSVPEHIVRQVVQKAKEKGFRVEISVTITHENYQSVSEMCNQTHEMGADGINMLKYIKSGSAKEEDRRVLTDAEKKDFFYLVDAARGRYDKSELTIRTQGTFGPREGTKREELANRNEYCPAGERLFVIDPNGKIYGCPFLMEHPIGELTNDFELKIHNNLCDGKRNVCLTDIIDEDKRK